MLEREIIRNLDYNKRGWQAAKSTGRRKEKQNLEPQRTQRSTEENPKSTANQRTEGKQNLEPQRTQRSTEENPKKTRHIRGQKENKTLNHGGRRGAQRKIRQSGTTAVLCHRICGDERRF
jgi:hypothetical protein